MHTDWAKIIAEIPDEEFKKAFSLFEKKGYLTDEDGTFISKIMIKDGFKQLIEAFQKEGCYYAEQIKITAKYYDSHGEIACIYDTKEFPKRADIIKILDQYVKDYQSNNKGWLR